MICFVHRSLTLAILLFSATFAIAQVPRTMSVQGVLTGSQFNSKQYQVIITSLYAVGEKSFSLYTQTDTLNVDRDGLFTIQLGKEKGLPTSLAFDKQYVVEFTVNGNVIPMRIPLQSVPYAITSEKVSDNSVELRHLSDELKQKLLFQQDAKSAKSENILANYIGGFRSVIAGGDENRTSANYASITGGFTNSVSGTFGTIGGGQSNMVPGNYGFVGGGSENRAQGSWSTVTAGNGNIVSSSSMYGTVSGGQTNQVGGNHGTIGGGRSNVVASQSATVSGGQENRAMQTFATVSGGQNNATSGMHSTIGGGNGNIASGQVSIISGGMNNKSTGQYSVVSGGLNNESIGSYSNVSGGLNNDANGDFTTISGGQDNVVSSNARHSFIAGGTTNRINSGMNSGIMGSNNTVTTSSNGYIIGTNNTVSSSSNGMSFGFNNQVSGLNATAIGMGNIANGNNEFVLGSFASNSTNPAATTNTAFTGNRRFSVGIGSSVSQRKNAITVFENGNTVFQGKVLTTETAYLNSAEIANDIAVRGDMSVTGDATVNGTLNATGQFNASNLSGTNTGDVTIGTANGLSMNGQTLSLATVTTTTAGAMSASDKVKLNSIATGAEVNVNADWNAVSGDAEILNKPTLGTMSAETASDYYTKTQTDAGFQVKDADLTTVATIGTNNQLLKVKNDGSGLEWFTPSYISSYTETDPQVGTIASSGIPRWNGTALVTGSISDDGTNVSTSGTFTSSNLSGTNTGDVTIGTASGLSLTGQVLSLATATITDAGAMSASDKTKLNSIATGAEVNVNADWNAVSGDAEILNKPTLGTMSAETASDYYTKAQSDAGFQVKDADLTTVATIGSNNQLLKVKNDGSGLEWFTPSYISSYTETDPQVGTIASNGVPRWNGTALVTGSLSDDGTNLTTSGTITASNISGTNSGDVTIGTANGLSISGQTLSLATATTTTAGAMSSNDKGKLESISNSLVPGAHGQMLFSCNGALQWGPCLPIVSTTTVTGVSDVQANTGGSVNNEGGVSVTTKGVVWNTSPNPTVSLSTKTIDGSGIGSFTSILTGLTRLTTYYVRAYATNSSGTSYGTEYSFTTLNTLQIGDSYQGGIIAYIYQPGDVGYIAGETHGLIAAESDFSTKYIYGCAGINIVGAGSVTNGQQNTIDIVSGCSTPNIAAKVCNDLVLNGYTDWYLPSRDELTILYQNRNSIGGFALGFSPDFYWSSTECDNTPGNACDPPTSWAFARRFSDGNNGTYTKGSSLRVRAVRKF